MIFKLRKLRYKYKDEISTYYEIKFIHFNNNWNNVTIFFNEKHKSKFAFFSKYLIKNAIRKLTTTFVLEKARSDHPVSWTVAADL